MASTPAATTGIPAWPKDALRVSFGIIWLIDAILKWLPGFRSDYMSVIMSQAQGQPGWLRPWFDFWINLQHPRAVLFAYLVAVIETLVALALIAGFARKVTYISAIVFSLLIWATAEGFGGPYTSGSSDIGTAVIYAVVFAGLLALSAYAGPARYSADYYLEKRISWWWRLAEVRRPVQDIPAPAPVAGGSMMGGGTGYGWMMGGTGYRWMMGGATAPAWMRGHAVPGFMMGGSRDPGKVMGALWANSPGPQVSPAQASRLSNLNPAGATIDRAANRITFTGSSVRLAVLASPAGGPDETFRIAGLVNPAITVSAGARVSIEVINADPDTAHGLVVTASHGTASWMPMMTTRPAFPGAALWFLGNPTSAGMHAGTLTFTASTRGTYRYLCPVPGHAQKGMAGSFTVR